MVLGDWIIVSSYYVLIYFAYWLLNAGFSPNYSTYSWIVDGYCNQNKADAVLSLPEELIRRGLLVDKSVYRALIRRLCKRGLVDYAQKILIQMHGKGLLGDSLVYATLAFAYLSAGKPIAASEALDEMAKKKLVITARIYSCLSASYANENDMLELLWNHASEKGLIAKNVYKLMQQSGLNFCSYV